MKPKIKNNVTPNDLTIPNEAILDRNDDVVAYFSADETDDDDVVKGECRFLIFILASLACLLPSSVVVFCLLACLWLLPSAFGCVPPQRKRKIWTFYWLIPAIIQSNDTSVA